LNGIGFVFTEENGIIANDLDDCLIDGQPNELAASVLAKIPQTYIEISPSGNGLHFLIRGKMPGNGKGKKNDAVGVEMYGASRYFTITGSRYTNCADNIAHDNGVLEWIYSTYLNPPKQSKSKKKTANQANIQQHSGSHLTDERLLEMANAAKDGATAEHGRGSTHPNPRQTSPYAAN